MQLAPCTNVSSWMLSPSACFIFRIRSRLTSRARITRSQPISRYSSAAGVFTVLACVLTCTGSPGTSFRSRRIAPGSLTITASAPAASASRAAAVNPSSSSSKG